MAARPGISGLLGTNLAVALFGLSGVVGSATGLSAPLIVLGRVVFGALTLLVVFRVRQVPLRVSRRQLPALVTQGLVLTVHWGTFFQAINVGGVAIGLISFATFPLFTAALEPLVLRVRPRRAEVLASVAILLGVYVLVPEFTLRSAALQAVLWGLASAATFAVLSVYNRKLGRAHDSSVLSFYQFAVAVLVLTPVLVWDHPHRLVEPGALALLVFLGSVCTALAHTLFISGLRTVTAMTASVLASLEPVWGLLFAAALLGQTPDARSLAGGAIIVAASLVAGRGRAAP